MHTWQRCHKWIRIFRWQSPFIVFHKQRQETLTVFDHKWQINKHCSSTKTNLKNIVKLSVRELHVVKEHNNINSHKTKVFITCGA